MKKNYLPKQPNRRASAKRPRRPLHNSKLPKWLIGIPVVARFMQLTRRRKIILAAWAGASVLILIGLFTTIYFANSLGSKEQIMNRNKTGLTLTDQNDEVFYQFYNARSNTYVTLDQVAPSTVDALISSEDKNFFNHGGFSPQGIASAVYENIRPQGINSGGSTITQQLVKNALLSEDRSLLRKYQELVLSIEIERRFSKEEILEMYLNSVYFGEGAFGIEDAAQVYFNVPASDLTLAQGSMLVGVLPAPSAFSPRTGSLERATSRQNYVLGRMVEDQKISEDEKVAAQGEVLTYAELTEDDSFRAPHFALMVKEELEERYGEEQIARSGYIVKTSLNLDWQNKAEASVARQVNALAGSSVSNGSAVVIDPKTGEIRALVGSKDWNDESFGKFNIATATRQPGSSFKPIVYATGIEDRDFSAASIFDDKATTFGGSYRPNNFDLRFRGNVTLRRALATSLNIPAVEALRITGIEDTVQTARELGMTTIDEEGDYGLSMALGSAPARLTELTNAYAAFANGGKINEMSTVSSIKNKEEREIFRNNPRNREVISAQTSFIMSSMLSDQAARSEVFGGSLALTQGRPAAVKTGTTENFRDAWTVGYTPSVAVGVWIGNNDNTPMSRVAGSGGAGPIWRGIMQDVLAGRPVEQFEQPSGLTVRTICRGDGGVARNPGPNTMTEYFLPGTLPTTTCNEERPEEPPAQPAPRPQEEDDEEEEPEEPEEAVDPPEEDTEDPEPPVLP